MNTMKSALTVMIMALAVVGCDSNSGGGNGNNGVYPQPTVIGPYDQGQYPPGQYPPGQYPGGQPGNPQVNQAIQPGNYNATIRCDNESAANQMSDVAISFSLMRDGSYNQEIISVDYRCRQNCTMVAEGRYSTSTATITLNQTRLVNEYGGMLQGPRNNTLQIESNNQMQIQPRSKKSSSVIVLRDNGTDNVCGGPFRMILKKEGKRSRY
ncbi:hypothetical protein ACLVWU_10880 [Bdellovibrio sp. HCB290]|uniref:hypothetical protein n=1 Tax=Bdellovibrio sp. HCB290 TaxID=3394356 RepID=UPI0039B6752F